MPIERQILFYAVPGDSSEPFVDVLQGFDVEVVATVSEVRTVTAGRRHFDLVVFQNPKETPATIESLEVVRRRLPLTPILEICAQSPYLDSVDYIYRGSAPAEFSKLVRQIFNPQTARSLGIRSPLV